MILIIDNYDSFVYNLAQYIGELGGEPKVYRNDAIAIRDIELIQPSHIIISPGPCTPLEAGISNEVILRFGSRIPILGVCLGHQCIGYVYGTKIIHASVPTHGKSSMIYHDGQVLFDGLPECFQGGRYHSLVVQSVPLINNNTFDINVKTSRPSVYSDELEVSAWTTDGTIMGIRHKKYSVEGVQFHPESIMTLVGHKILSNFLNIVNVV